MISLSELRLRGTAQIDGLGYFVVSRALVVRGESDGLATVVDSMRETHALRCDFLGLQNTQSRRARSVLRNAE